MLTINKKAHSRYGMRFLVLAFYSTIIDYRRVISRPCTAISRGFQGSKPGDRVHGRGGENDIGDKPVIRPRLRRLGFHPTVELISPVDSLSNRWLKSLSLNPRDS